MVYRIISCAVLIAACCGTAQMAVAQEPLDYTIQGSSGDGTVQPVYAVPPQQIPTLAYNYYYPAPGSGYMPARLYLSPRPVPLHVGYTWITYQPLAPHEFLWRHQRTYYRVHPDGGVTYTRLNWR